MGVNAWQMQLYAYIVAYVKGVHQKYTCGNTCYVYVQRSQKIWFKQSLMWKMTTKVLLFINLLLYILVLFRLCLTVAIILFNNPHSSLILNLSIVFYGLIPNICGELEMLSGQ